MLWYLPSREVSLTPRAWGEGVDGLVQYGLQGLARAFGQAFAGDEQFRPPVGIGLVRSGALEASMTLTEAADVVGGPDLVA